MNTFSNDNELIQYIHNEIVNTKEAAEMLGCTRQNIKRLVDINELTPVKIMNKDKLFLKKHIIKRQLIKGK